MIQYVARRMMEMDVEGRCAAAFGGRNPERPTAATATASGTRTPAPGMWT